MSGALIWSVVSAALAATAAAALNTLGASRGLWFTLGMLTPYVAATIIIALRFPKGQRFGLANGVTLMRLALACILCGVTIDQLAFQQPMAPVTAWSAFAIAAVAMILDGIDGYLARRLGLASPFGARFDMEVDAFQILVLAILAATLDKADAWVIVGGAMRYAFVAASLILPWLNGELPVSWRRKATAVVQGGSLTVLVAPAIVPPLSTIIAAMALALLVISFAIDIAWLARAARTRQVAV